MNKRLQSSAAAVHRRPATPTEGGEEDSNQNPLIPGLPDHIAPLCLRRLPPSLLFSVSSSWRSLLYSPLFPPFLSLYALFSRSSAAAGHFITPVEFMTYDPVAGEWFTIPPPPPPPIRLILRHPSFISRDLPIQSLAVAGRLVLLSGTGDGLLPAFPLPLVFSPLSATWSYGPALKAPRRWCAAGTLAGSVYVASGIGSQFSSETARSFEKWNAVAGGGDRWERLGELKDGRLSREAIDAVGCKGKLFMVNVKGSAAKQGAVYDAGEGEWEEMPEKMIGGWSGPAAAMAGEEIYVVDESKGILKVWDWEGNWVEVVESPMLRGAKQIAAAGGRICAVVVGAGGIVMVDVKASPARVWVVEAPPEYEAIAVHVLPRICR